MTIQIQSRKKLHPRYYLRNTKQLMTIKGLNKEIKLHTQPLRPTLQNNNHIKNRKNHYNDSTIPNQHINSTTHFETSTDTYQIIKFLPKKSYFSHG